MSTPTWVPRPAEPTAELPPGRPADPSAPPSPPPAATAAHGETPGGAQEPLAARAGRRRVTALVASGALAVGLLGGVGIGRLTAPAAAAGTPGAAGVQQGPGGAGGPFGRGPGGPPGQQGPGGTAGQQGTLPGGGTGAGTDGTTT